MPDFGHQLPLVSTSGSCGTARQYVNHRGADFHLFIKNP